VYKPIDMVFKGGYAMYLEFEDCWIQRFIFVFNFHKITSVQGGVLISYTIFFYIPLYTNQRYRDERKRKSGSYMSNNKDLVH